MPNPTLATPAGRLGAEERGPSPERRSVARAAVATATQLIVVVGSAAISVVLRSGVPVVPNTSAYDGLLFARLARSMRAGEWLGEFHQLTLAKGPGYPAFLAVVSWLGLDLKVAEQIAHLTASAAVAVAILVAIHRRWAAVLAFAVLALDPANFGTQSSDVMRENLFASLGVLALALAFLTCVGVVREASWLWVGPGAIATGTSVAGYWLTREEGVTILPPLAVAVLGVGLTAVLCARRAARSSRATIASARSRRRPALRAGGALVLMAVAAVLPLSVIRSVNGDHYGVRLLQDQGEGAFLRAYADWTRVEAGPRQPRISISEQQRESVYAVSPVARDLRAVLEDPENGWRYFGCADPENMVCDYTGGWMIWAIREAAVEAGHFDDARSGQEFFAQLSEDITRACQDGRLECAPALPASLQPLQRVSAGALADSSFMMLRDSIRADALYETPTELVEVPREVRAEYAPVVAELPVSTRAAEAEMADFQDRREVYRALADVYLVLVPVAVGLGVVGTGWALVRSVRGRASSSYLPSLALAFATSVLVRALLLGLIHSTEFGIPARYLLPGYAGVLAFAVVGIAAGLSPRARPAVSDTDVTSDRWRRAWSRPGWPRRRHEPDPGG